MSSGSGFRIQKPADSDTHKFGEADRAIPIPTRSYHAAPRALSKTTAAPPPTRSARSTISATRTIDSDAYEYTLSGPPASTITDLSTTTESTSGTPQDSSNGTLIPAYWNTYANALATSMGTSPLDAPIQNGTTSGEWDTSQGLASAVGGQDMRALQFTGAEVQPAISGSAVALEQGGGGSGIWASHPSAIGYRRQGYTTGGSHGGSGSGTITIAAVAPEFDSGMNAGTGQDEVERLGNFGGGPRKTRPWRSRSR